MKRLLVTAVVVLLLALGLGGWWWTRESLPVLDGELGVSGLKDPVEVVFDAYGVPHVYARDPEDVWFAAGVLHARERLWQMELYRRVTAGRLSEVMGETTLPIDKRFLTLNLRAAAEAEWARARPEVKTALERYAAGVNAVASRLIFRQRPLEMQVLGLTPGRVDAGRHAGRGPPARVAPGREPPVRTDPRRRCGEARRRGRASARRAVSRRRSHDPRRGTGLRSLGRWPAGAPARIRPSGGSWLGCLSGRRCCCA